MTAAHPGTPAREKPLRLWPGIAAVVLLWLARLGIKAVVPGFEGFAQAVMGSIAGGAAVIVWWVCFSRAPWIERGGALGLMALALWGTWLTSHETMGPLWLIAYAVPVLCLAFVTAVVATRRLAARTRRFTVAAAILLGCGVWTLFRTEGVNGDHVAVFRWRWTASAEERLLARVADDAAALPAPEPVASAGAAATSTAPPGLPVPAPGRAAPPRPVDAPERAGEPVVRPATADAPATTVSWSGFRGPDRDGTVHGIRLATDWSRLPPVELWRRPVGPGWSSFAVRGDLFYTQEQRGGDEVVACYRVSTGQPVWAHRDAARFFESNGGAGPRATPAIHGERVYAFGATGILNALDAETGSVVWSRNVASDASMAVPIWGFSSSPLVVDDIVIVAAAGQLVAYDLATGAPRWFGPDGGGGYSSPHLLPIEGTSQVLLMSDTGTIAVSPADGKRLWEHLWPGNPIVQPAITPDGGILISASSTSGTRRIVVVRRAGGWVVEERWTSNALKPYFNAFVVHEGHAYGFDGRILAALSLEDGTRKWKAGRYGNGQLVLLPEQDLLMVLSEEGELALVGATPDGFNELARLPAIAGKTWNHPVVTGDVVLVRNGEEMAAFRLALADR
jgi:outer membrane protein assembly factor BamB